MFDIRKLFRRGASFGAIDSPPRLSVLGLVLSLVVPGFSFFVCGRPLLGCIFTLSYWVSAFLFAAALGYQVGSIAYGLMISVHASSIFFVEAQWLHGSRFRTRLGLALCTLFAVWALIYAPALNFTERNWLLPMRIGNRVLVIRRGVQPETLRRGEWIAYEIRGGSNRGTGEARLYVSAGLGVDPILGLPGDHIRFTRKVVLANGQPFPLQPHMPTQGEWSVPQKVWFVWPSLAINWRGGVPESDIVATMESIAAVGPDRMIGRAFKHWFWRQQWP